MNIIEYTKDTLKNGVELFNDEIVMTNSQGITIRRNTAKLRAICLGAISSNDAKEWYRVCRLSSPVGTIIEPFEDNEDAWNELFNDTIALVRCELTKCLLKERAAKSAKTLLDILTKRDKEHWADDKVKKDLSIKSPGPIDVTFTVVD